jgi:hypothetical protein
MVLEEEVKMHTSWYSKLKSRIKIKYLSCAEMGQWKGMNHYASVEMGLKLRPKPMEIFIDNSISEQEKKEVIKHEICEIYFMKNKGMKYSEAHQIALAFEDE